QCPVDNVQQELKVDIYHALLSDDYYCIIIHLNLINMVNEICNKCNRALVLDGENLCPYCILALENGDENTVDVNCGICKIIVEEDSEGLFCDVCNSWFHNDCVEIPLDYELYALMNEAPKNVKWFCDKCIWETEKWIRGVSKKQHTTSTDNDKLHKHLNSEEWNNSLDLDGSEDNEEFIKLQQKKKRKKNTNVQDIVVFSDILRPASKMFQPENILNRLDISPEKLSNITNEIISVKKTKHIRSKCNLCPKAFIHLEDCIAHILSDHEGVQKPFKCSVCKTVWGTKKALHKHTEIHMRHEENDAEFVETNDCKESDNYIEDGAEYANSSDSEGSDYKTNFNKKYQCSGEKPFQCSQCEKSFTHITDLENHMKTHSMKRPYQCSYCEKAFKLRETLKRHLSTHTREKPYKCNHCDKSFIQYNMLMSHIRTHTGDKPYLCIHCGKAFKHNGLLRSHIWRHTAEKSYVCNHCGKAFRENSKLQCHLKIHTGEKPYLCNECGKVFTENTGLSRHLKTHTGEKPYKCNHCDNTFRRNDQLISHLRIHTGEKPYICSHCGKGYSHNCQLKTHLRTHT
ncbi:unnamed protein product, partial [Meganyctiphanes norvegica]